MGIRTAAINCQVVAIAVMGLMNPTSFAQCTENGASAHAQIHCGSGPGCCDLYPHLPAPSSESPTPYDEGSAPPEVGDLELTFDEQAAAFAGDTFAMADAPYMLGDSFGGPRHVIDDDGFVAIAPRGGGSRGAKIADNSSPLPRCRYFFNYNHFHNAMQYVDSNSNLRDRSVDRYTFGLEHCFWNSLMSVELRVPFAQTLNSDQTLGSDVDVSDTEFGNIAVNVKGLLYQTESCAVSAGLGITTPTSDSFRLYDFGGGRIFLEVKDEAVHLMPFLGLLLTPNEQLFVQSFIQFDFDASGSDVFDDFGFIGTLNEQALMYVDFSIGYWLFQNPDAHLLTGLAALFELHYTTTLQDADEVFNNNAEGIRNGFNRMDVINLTAGLTMSLGQLSSLTVAAVAPVTDGHHSFNGYSFAERFFDSEVLVQFNRSY